MNLKFGNLMKIGMGAVLASTIAACGGGAVVHQHSTGGKATPKPTAKASPTPSGNGLTLAMVNELNYLVHFPAISCNTLPKNIQQEWLPLISGSSVGMCAPENFVATAVPTNIQVVNDDPAMSQAQANAYGEAYATTMLWIWWAWEYDAPGVLNALGLQGGVATQELQAMQNGYRVYGNVPGYAVFFNKLYVVPLNSAEQTAMGGATENFALVATSVQHAATVTLRLNSSQAPHATTVPAGTPSVSSGTITANPVLGKVFSLTNSFANCTTGATAGICAAAGVS